MDAPANPGVMAPSRRTPSLTFGAHEAPAHVDVGMVPLPLAGSEVGSAHDAVGRDHQAAGRQARVPAVVGHGAAHAPHHFTCGQTGSCGEQRDRPAPPLQKHRQTAGNDGDGQGGCGGERSGKVRGKGQALTTYTGPWPVAQWLERRPGRKGPEFHPGQRHVLGSRLNAWLTAEGNHRRVSR